MASAVLAEQTKYFAFHRYVYMFPPRMPTVTDEANDQIMHRVAEEVKIKVESKSRLMGTSSTKKTRKKLIRPTGT